MSSWRCTISRCERISPFASKANRNRHMSQTHGPPKKCPWCTKTFGRLYRVREHINAMHGQAIMQSIPGVQQPRFMKICSWCELGSYDDYEMFHHIDTCHPARGTRTDSVNNTESNPVDTPISFQLEAPKLERSEGWSIYM